MDTGIFSPTRPLVRLVGYFSLGVPKMRRGTCPSCGAGVSDTELLSAPPGSPPPRSRALLRTYCPRCGAEVEVREAPLSHGVILLLCWLLGIAAVVWSVELRSSRLFWLGVFLGPGVMSVLREKGRRKMVLHLLGTPNPALQPTVPPSASLPSQAPPAQRG